MSTFTPPDASRPSARPATATVAGDRDEATDRSVVPDVSGRSGAPAGRGSDALIAAGALAVVAVAIVAAVRSASPWSVVVAGLVAVWAVAGAVAARRGGIRALGIVMLALAAIG